VVRLPQPADKFVFPHGINASGTIAGMTWDNIPFGGGRVFQFNPSTDTQLQFLAVPTGNGTAINDAGQVTGIGYFDGTGLPRMFRTLGSTVENFGIPAGAIATQANAIDASGGLVGYTIWADRAHTSAIRYTDALGLEYLNQLLPTGSDWDLDPIISGDFLTTGNGTNGTQIVGSGQTGNGLTRGFVLVPGDGSPGSARVTQIAMMSKFLNDANRTVSPRAINSFGEVVGTVTDYSGIHDLNAFIWVEGTGIVDLNDLIDPASGWVLSGAYAINDKHEVVGMGWLNGEPRAGGQERAFKMTVPDLSPCPAIDSCHGPGVRDLRTGQCSAAVLADGTACSDGSSCTLNDTCHAGTCQGTLDSICSTIPGLDGVATVGDRKIAVFFYENTSGETAKIPYGAQNFLTTPAGTVADPSDPPPTWFAPGVHHKAFTVPLDSTFVSWTVGTHTVTADASSPTTTLLSGFDPSVTDIMETPWELANDATLVALGQPPIGPTAAGAMDGRFSVGDDGTAHYELPIETPHGRNGIEPHLSLVYGSRGGNGPMGPGWSIKGLGRIERCPRVPAVAIDRQLETKPITFDSTDELCLDGERLVRIGDGSSGLGEYRTQRDMFARIVVVTQDDLGPVEIDVYRKDGTIEGYGSDAQSRLEATQKTPVAVNDTGPVQVTSRTVRLAWGLGRISDRYGNAMTVSYKTRLSPEEGLGFTANLGLHPSEISYTSNALTSRPATRFVDFVYDTALADPQELFSAGVLTYRLLRLSSIVVRGPNPYATSRLRSYQFTYRAESITDRQLLIRISKCDADGRCLAPTQFGWEPGSLGFTRTDSGIDDAYDGVSDYGDVRFLEAASRVIKGFDVDGDGRDDLFYRRVIPQTTQMNVAMIPANDATWQVRLSNGSTFGQVVDPGITFTTSAMRNNIFYPDAQPIDLNGDGKLDIAIYNASFVQDAGSPYDLYHATNAGHFVREPTGLTGAAFTDPAQNPEYDRPSMSSNFLTLDLAGTGTPILFRAIGRNIEGVTPMRSTYAYRPYSSSGVVPYTLLNALLPGGGNVFEEIQMTGTPLVGDFDGDGKVEFLNVRQSVFTFDFDNRYSAIGMSRSRVASQTLTTLPAGRSSYLIADTNGDGLPDALRWFVKSDGTPAVEQRRNLGTGFFDGFPIESTVTQGRVTDVDGDGKQDILVLQCAQPGGTASHPIAFLSRGEGFIRKELTDIPLSVGIPTAATIFSQTYYRCVGAAMDIDGDGQLDIVQVEPGKPNVQIYTRARGRADRLTSIEDGLGHITTVEYGSVGSAFDNCQFPRSCAQRRVETVKAYETATGSSRAPSDRTRFTVSYSTPHVDALGRGWIGFLNRTTTNTRTGAHRTVAFDNTRDGTVYPHAGLPTNEIFEVTLDSGRSIRRSRSIQYKTIVGIPATGGPYAVRPWIITDREDEHALGANYDFDHPQRLQQTTLTFDTFGNLTNQVVENALAGRTDSYDATYDIDQPAWLISEIRTSHRSSVVAATGERQDQRTSYTVEPISGGIHDQIVEPEGDADTYLATTYVRDLEGQLQSITRRDANGVARTDRILYDYVDGTYPRGFTNPAGHTTQVVYHGGMGHLMLTVDPNGVQRSWQYDKLGQLIAAVGPDSGRVISYQKGQNGEGMETVVRGTALDYDSTVVDVMGRPVRHSARRWDGRATLQSVTMTYDVVTGKVASVSRPFEALPDAVPGFITTFSYDALGRLRSVATPSEFETTIEYEGLKTTSKVGSTTKGYRVTDQTGEIVRSVSVEPSAPGGEIGTTFELGPFGQIRHVRHDAESSFVTIGYDQLGRPILLDDPDTGPKQLHYNAFGEPRESIDADARVTDFLRDTLGRIFQESADGHVSSFVWDQAGNGIGQLASSKSGWGGSEIFYGYAANGTQEHATWIIDDVSYRVGTKMDDLGRLLTLTYPGIGLDPPMTATLGYSQFDGGLTNVTWSGGAGAQAFSRPIWQKTEENGDGMISKESFGNGELSLRQYDPATGRLVHVAIGTGAELPGPHGLVAFEQNHQNLTYSYQPDGLLGTRDDLQLDLHEEFTYDNVGRLKTWAPGDATVTYDYSEIGNLKARHVLDASGTTTDTIFTYAHPTKPHAITAAPWGSFGYDLSGRQIVRPGQPLLTYTTFDLPLAINTSGSSTSTTFEYDAMHRRIVKKGPNAQTLYVGGLYEKRTAANVEHVIYFPGPEGVVAQVTCAPTILGISCNEPAYIHADRLGSPDTITDSQGVVSHIKRDPYGQIVDPANPTMVLNESVAGETTIGFVGGEQDRELDLVNLNHRLYDPRTARFISPDPLLFDMYWGQSYNRFSYALNNPMAFVDPTGLQSEPPPPGCDECPQILPEQIPGAVLFPPDFTENPWPSPGTEALATPTPAIPPPIVRDPEALERPTIILATDRSSGVSGAPSANVSDLARIDPHLIKDFSPGGCSEASGYKCIGTATIDGVRKELYQKSNASPAGEDNPKLNVFGRFMARNVPDLTLNPDSKKKLEGGLLVLSIVLPMWGGARALLTDILAEESGLAELATFRAELGLAKGEGTIAKLEVGEGEFWGINAHGQPVSPLKVNAISATHAEADAFAQAARAGVKGGSGKLIVDRALCPACGTFGAVRSMARQLQLESLEVVTPTETFTINP
jgi:RHS repeat-associated protein